MIVVEQILIKRKIYSFKNCYLNMKKNDHYVEQYEAIDV